MYNAYVWWRFLQWSLINWNPQLFALCAGILRCVCYIKCTFGSWVNKYKLIFEALWCHMKKSLLSLFLWQDRLYSLFLIQCATCFLCEVLITYTRYHGLAVFNTTVMIIPWFRLSHCCMSHCPVCYDLINVCLTLRVLRVDISSYMECLIVKRLYAVFP